MTELRNIFETLVSFNEWMSLNRALVTLVTTLMVHLFAIAWWASSVSNRLDVIEGWVSDNRGLSLYMHRLDERTKSIKETVERLREINQ